MTPDHRPPAPADHPDSHPAEPLPMEPEPMPSQDGTDNMDPSREPRPIIPPPEAIDLA